VLKAVWVIGVATGAAMAGAGAPAWAIPLEPAACNTLDQERGGLLSSGVLDDLHLAAKDAAALPKERILRVQRYVEVSGQILFRCQVAAKPDSEPGDAAAVDAPSGPTAPEAPKSRRALAKKRGNGR